MNGDARTEPEPLPTPKTVNLSVTGRCNLRCQYCFFANEMTALADLPLQSHLDLFVELNRLGVMDVCLSGGEPFTRPDLFELIDGITANRMRYNILSNGTLIDEKMLKQFEKGKRRLRLNYIQVSIDGSTAEIHDRSRPGSFDRALRGLRLLRNSGFPVMVRVTINRHNVDDLENIARLLLEEIGVPAIGSNEAMPVGSGCHNERDICLTPAGQRKAMETIGRLMDRYPGRLNASAGPQAKLKMYAEMELARRTGEKPRSWTMGSLSACGCVFSTIDILHDGSVVPCAMLPDLVLGNVSGHNLEEIWLSHPILNALRRRRLIPMEQVPGCERCEWAASCNGSCPGLAYQLVGDFNHANPQDCYRRFLDETVDTHAL
jgi:SynChlorMet cassette radical SAM/SPASM protein ScmE